MGAVIAIVVIGAALWWWLAKGRAASDAPMAPPVPPAPTRASTPIQAEPALARARTTSTRVSTTSKRSARTGQAVRWVPVDEVVDVRGRAIKGGVYVGSSIRGIAMPAVSEWRGVEPALIDPRLRTDDTRPDRLGTTMTYWPSYSEMTPAARAAYLDWLAAGRPPDAYVGYPFVFFAGIERRVLVDAQSDDTAKAEVPLLLNEVERLLQLYANDHSFHGYATGFLAIARVMYLAGSIDEIEPPQERNGWQLPVEIQLAVGTMVEEGRPIPPEWALAWVRTHPGIWLRTPAQRCPDEFGDLFMRHYRERYGEGLRVRKPKRRMQLTYRPASSSFGGSVEVTMPNLPDISELTAPTTKLAAIAVDATESLSSYSRHVGKTDDRDSLAAIALLPPPLIRVHGSPELAAMVTRLEKRLETASMALVPVEELLALWPNDGESLSRKEAASLARLLAARGLGLEPDARFGPLNLARHERAVVWRLSEIEAETDVTAAFGAACAILRLGVMLAQADGHVAPEELARLEQHLDRTLDLTEQERSRLRAHLHWLAAETLGQAGLKKQLAEIEPDQHQAIARLLIAVAAADGQLHAKEMAALARAYTMLGLDPASVHGDLHAFAAGDEPVPILDADRDNGDRTIPEPPAGADSAHQVVLDRARIDRVLKSTEEVSAVLTTVFADDSGDSTPPDVPDPGDSGHASIAGLDAAHSELVRRVATQPVWSRTEFESLVGSLGLMPGGAIEAVNDIAFETTGEPLLEGTEEFEVNGHALKELLND